MMWRFDVENAPKDTKVIVATEIGSVDAARYNTGTWRHGWWGEDENGQNLGVHDDRVVAWMPWPTHPAKGHVCHDPHTDPITIKEQS